MDVGFWIRFVISQTFILLKFWLIKPGMYNTYMFIVYSDIQILILFSVPWHNSHCWGLLVTGRMGLSSLSPLVLLCLGARADVEVETHSGRVRGAIKQFQGQDGSGQYFSFKGIPYAQPPVGDQVWRDPEPVSNWDGEVWRWHKFGLTFRSMVQ